MNGASWLITERARRKCERRKAMRQREATLHLEAAHVGSCSMKRTSRLTYSGGKCWPVWLVFAQQVATGAPAASSIDSDGWSWKTQARGTWRGTWRGTCFMCVPSLVQGSRHMTAHNSLFVLTCSSQHWSSKTSICYWAGSKIISARAIAMTQY